jgi:uncharacterized protein with PQ loop repeat
MASIWDVVYGFNMGCCLWLQYGMLFMASIWDVVYGFNMGYCLWLQYGMLFMASIWDVVYVAQRCIRITVYVLKTKTIYVIH